MARSTFICLVFMLIASPLFAQEVGFYIVSDDPLAVQDETTLPLTNLFDYVKENAGFNLKGKILVGDDETKQTLSKPEAQVAIVSPDFFEKNKESYQLKKILGTIPSYSTGPFERYYIMTHRDTDVATLSSRSTSVTIFASKIYSKDFLSSKIFVAVENEMTKIPWFPLESKNIVESIKQIAAGQTDHFALLTGYEFSIINNLRKRNPELIALKLVYSSPQFPSNALVSVGAIDPTTLAKVKKALVDMTNNLQGNLILKQLKLKGFAEL